MRYSIVIKKKMIRETQKSEKFDNKFVLELLERKICKLIF